MTGRARTSDHIRSRLEWLGPKRLREERFHPPLNFAFETRLAYLRIPEANRRLFVLRNALEQKCKCEFHACDFPAYLIDLFGN